MRLLARALTTSALAVGLAATAILPASADVTADEGVTDVVVAPALYDFLVGAGVEIAPTGDASAAPFQDTVKATFPITDITKKGNKITHSGGLELSLDEVDIKVRNFIVRLDQSRVSGRATGSEIGDAGRVTLFRIKASDDPELGAVSLTLTTTGAGAVNATFGTDFVRGDLFGYATPQPAALPPHLHLLSVSTPISSG